MKPLTTIYRFLLCVAVEEVHADSEVPVQGRRSFPAKGRGDGSRRPGPELGFLAAQNECGAPRRVEAGQLLKEGK